MKKEQNWPFTTDSDLSIVHVIAGMKPVTKRREHMNTQNETIANVDSEIDRLENSVELSKFKVPGKREAHSLYWKFRDAEYSHLAAVLAVHSLHNIGADNESQAESIDKKFAEHVDAYRENFEGMAAIGQLLANSNRNDDVGDDLDDVTDDGTVPRS